jgi:hypothetical protein
VRAAATVTATAWMRDDDDEESWSGMVSMLGRAS